MSPTRVFWLIMLVLVGASIFFTVSVERKRRAWSTHEATVRLAAGQEVEPIKVIDGDELSVRAGADAFIVRLLGIKCFAAKTNDPVVALYGARCVQALTELIDKKALTVDFDGPSENDERGRTLAYLSAAGIDVGRSLVADGYAMVYTRYAFGREAGYQVAEREARRLRRGMWRDARVARRIEALKAEWATQRAR